MSIGKNILIMVYLVLLISSSPAQQYGILKPPRFTSLGIEKLNVSGLIEDVMIRQPDTLSYRFAGEPDTSVQILGQDWVLQWFVAPTDLEIKSIGIDFSQNLNGSSIEFRIIKMNLDYRQLTDTSNTNWGYYLGDSTTFNGITAFSDLEGSTGDWFSANEINSDNPFGKIEWNSDEIPNLIADTSSGYQWFNTSLLGYNPSLNSYDVIAVAIKNQSEIAKEDSGLQIKALSTGYFGWRFFNTGKNNNQDSLGWWRTNLTFDIALAVRYPEPPCLFWDITKLEMSISTEPREICVRFICPNPSGGPTEVDTVFLNYSVNKGDYVKIPLTENDSSYWCGSIPGQSPGSKVGYFISVVYSDGYTYQSVEYFYEIFKPTEGVKTLVVFNSPLFRNVTGYPQDYYFGTFESNEYHPTEFLYDVWLNGRLTEELLEHYNNVVEITSTYPTNHYNDEVIRAWITSSPNNNYALFGQEWLGQRYSFIDKDFSTGDFEFDILGITHSYNDINHNGTDGQKLPTLLFAEENSLLGGGIFDLFHSQPSDSLRYDPIYELNDDNWIDGFDAVPDANIDFYAESRGVGGKPFVDTLAVGLHRTLLAGNKIVFLSFDPLAINTSPLYNWLGCSSVSPQVKTMEWFEVPVSIAENIKPLPEEYLLFQNYPNPFNSSTKIKFTIPPVETGHAPSLLRIYDILGREIATLVNEEKPSGNYEVTFDASNLSPKGSILTSGIYFYQLRCGGFIDTKKMILLR